AQELLTFRRGPESIELGTNFPSYGTVSIAHSLEMRTAAIHRQRPMNFQSSVYGTCSLNSSMRSSILRIPRRLRPPRSKLKHRGPNTSTLEQPSKQTSRPAIIRRRRPRIRRPRIRTLLPMYHRLQRTVPQTIVRALLNPSTTTTPPIKMHLPLHQQRP